MITHAELPHKNPNALVWVACGAGTVAAMVRSGPTSRPPYMQPSFSVGHTESISVANQGKST
jgi:hypothetical protein